MSHPSAPSPLISREAWTSAHEGQLSVDVLETNKEVLIRSTLAGVSPDDLDIHISQDIVTIHGSRKKPREKVDATYHYRECYWGGFSRTILLPSPIHPEKARAVLKDGILTLTLPKICLETRLEVKAL
jgi:HSP20 family protein